MELRQLKSGLLVRLTGRAGFKVAVVLGSAPSGKVRVCIWSQNQRTWSQPQGVKLSDLKEFGDLTGFPRWEQTVVYARRNLQDRPAVDRVGGLRGHMVEFKGGARMVGSVTTEPVRLPAPPEGVTKLTPPLKVTADEKKGLQELNRKLSNFMFGGRK